MTEIITQSTPARSMDRRMSHAHAPFSRARLSALLIALAIGATGCTSGKWGFPYRASVQQGNWITAGQVALLQPGMTRDQVQFALGSPVLTSILHSDRWDYTYFYQPGQGAAQHRLFTVWFENDRLVRWGGDPVPSVQPFQKGAQDGTIDLIEVDKIAEAVHQPAAPRTGVTEGLDIGGEDVPLQVELQPTPILEPGAASPPPMPL